MASTSCVFSGLTPPIAAVWPRWLSCGVSKLLALGGNDRNWFSLRAHRYWCCVFGYVTQLVMGLSPHLKNGLL